MTQKLFYQTTLACFFAGLVSAIVMLRVANWYLMGRVPLPILAGIAIIFFVGIVIYIFTGLRRAIQKPDKALALAAFWQGVLRYVIAFDLCSFGTGKFFHLQFNTPLPVLDNPFSSFDDAQLMWSFFGRFFAFTAIIGAMQIIGSVLLLYRRTRLFATIFLLPLLLNVLLLDYFYNYTGGVKYYITIETLALLYLLFTEYDRLADFFFKVQSSVPAFPFKNALWKNVLRFSVIYVPLLLIALFFRPGHFYPDINGKYEVKRAVINNVPQNTNTCADSVLSKVYIDKEDLILEFNSYQRRFIGRFRYDQAKNEIMAVWAYPANRHDTLFAKILPGKTAEMKILDGHMGKQAFRLDLLRVNNGR